MENILKTKAVSEVLDVNPTTIQRWVKYFNIPCQTNEKGHYLFEKKHIQLLKDIKQQLNEGRLMKDIILNDGTKEFKNVRTSNYVNQADQFIERLDMLEQKISGKADEVVSYQLLQHRNELDQMMSIIKELQTRVGSLEESLARNNQDSSNGIIEHPKKMKKNWLVSLLSI